MRICVLDALTVGKDLDLTPLSACGEVILYDLTSAEEVAERIQDVDVVITNKVMLGEENLKHVKNLKLIALLATGYNNIDIQYASKKGIGVANVAGYSTESVAQHTFAMLLHMIEHMGQYDEYVKSKAYTSSETFAYIAWPFHELKGKRLGIIGLGNIGKAVARIGCAFGMEVVYYSTSGVSREEEYLSVTLEELLATSDVVSIHAPYNERTHHLIDYDALKQMKQTAYLLNLGRGNIVVEEDLAHALNEGVLQGAGLDVLAHEPITKENPLFTVKDQHKILVTPHIGWASVEARNNLISEIVLNIEAYKKGQRRNRVV